MRRRRALPVTSTNVYVDAGAPPSIDSLVPAGDSERAHRPERRGVHHRQRLRDERVQHPGADRRQRRSATTNVTPTEIDLTLPDLSAGTHGLQVARPRLMGTPPTPHQGLLSNLVPLVVQPVIDLSAGNAPQVFFVSTSPVRSGRRSPAGDHRRGHGRVWPPPADGEPRRSIRGRPWSSPSTPCRRIRPRRRCPTRSRSIRARSRRPEATLVARFKRVVPGTYLIRIQVDGSSSALTVDPGTRPVQRADRRGHHAMTELARETLSVLPPPAVATAVGPMERAAAALRRLVERSSIAEARRDPRRRHRPRARPTVREVDGLLRGPAAGRPSRAWSACSGCRRSSGICCCWPRRCSSTPRCSAARPGGPMTAT